MAKGSSRSYRLRLSAEGTDLFLACHYRLARLTRCFIAYGATLSVAMRLLEQLDDEELIAELMTPKLPALGGNAEYFVGASPTLAQVAASVLERVDRSGSFAVPPPVHAIYVAALTLMASSEDPLLLQAYCGRLEHR